jgi:beta-galactosidase
MPGAYLDEFGRILPTGTGSIFEQTFGAVLNEFAYGSELNRPISIDGLAIEGFAAVLSLTSASAVASYADGEPAITEARVGKGTSVIIGAQASLSCWKPGHNRMEALIIKHALGPLKSPYACDGALAYRLSAPAADHYFIINDGPGRSVCLDTKEYRYKGVADAVTGEVLERGAPIPLPPYSGRWMRFTK